MTKRPFGKTGLSVSPLGFGAAPAAYLQANAQATADMLNRMLDAGINVIDTAASYPGSEEFIGRYMSARRSEFVLISKCGTALSGSDAPAWSRQLIGETVDRALRLLKTDVIDVMLLHSCDLETLKKGEAMGALIAARDAGKIRHAGYSGDNEAVAYASTLPDVAVVEMSISIADQKNIDLGLKAAREHNVGVIAKRPIANAAWKDISQQQGLYKDYAKDYTQRLRQMKLNPAELGLSGPAEQAWPELALRFTLAQAGVSTAIIGTTNPKNAQANLAAADKGPLPSDVMEKIRSAFREADPTGSWRGLT